MQTSISSRFFHQIVDFATKSSLVYQKLFCLVALLVISEKHFHFGSERSDYVTTLNSFPTQTSIQFSRDDLPNTILMLQSIYVTRDRVILKFEARVQIYVAVLNFGCEIQNSGGNFVSFSKINSFERSF